MALIILIVLYMYYLPKVLRSTQVSSLSWSFFQDKLWLIVPSLLILLCSVLYHLGWFTIEQEVPNYVWILVIIIIIAIFIFRFRKKIFKIIKTVRITWPKKFPKWLRSVLTFATIIALLWFIVIPHVRHWNWFSTSHDNTATAATGDRPMQVITSSGSTYSTLNTLGKKNKMKENEIHIVEFPISQSSKDYHLVFSTPPGDTTVVTLTYHHGDDTWRRKIWRDALDRPQSELLDIRPAPFPGACEIKADKNCHVVVKLEEVNK